MKVELTGMEFFAFHGCLEAERKNGNTFLVDVEYSYDATDAAAGDDLAFAVDYSGVYAIVRQQMEIPSNLLENVAWRIKTAILAGFPEIQDLSVSVSKLDPPVGGPCVRSRVTL